MGIEIPDESKYKILVDILKALFINAPAGITYFIIALVALQYFGWISEDVTKIFIILLLVLAFIGIVISFIMKEVESVRKIIKNTEQTLQEKEIDVAAAEGVINGG